MIKVLQFVTSRYIFYTFPTILVMQKKATLTVILLSCLFSFSWAQHHPQCGTSLSTFQKIEKRLIENKTYLKKHPIATSRNAITYLPIKFHLVGEDDGSGRVEYGRVLDQLCLLNEVFLEFDIAFYIKDGFNEVNDSRMYSNQLSSFIRNRMRSHKDVRALNIWVLGEVTTGNDNGVILGVYDDDNDWVRITNDRAYFGLTGYTLPHEIGHFFSLLHPFYGWEIEPYNQELEGNPAPVRAPSFNVLNEFADGSNCEIAGDRICDTPADYWYSQYVDSRGDTVNNMNNFSCKYDRPMTDPKGERLTPDPSLIMGYFLDQCMDHFTPGQIELMQADLQSGSRSYLRSNYTPTGGPIIGSPALTAPINSATSENYNWVPLSWEAINDANAYLIEVSRVPGFSDNPLNYISSTNSFTVKDLEANKSYFWRVTPYNDNFTCAAPSDRGRFKTGLSTSISPIEKVSNWGVYPNPTTVEKGLVLSVETTATIKADVKVFSLTGQLLKEESDLLFSNGSTNTAININDLQAGMYFVYLENETGILNKKFVVNK